MNATALASSKSVSVQRILWRKSRCSADDSARAFSSLSLAACISAVAASRPLCSRLQLISSSCCLEAAVTLWPSISTFKATISSREPLSLPSIVCFSATSEATSFFAVKDIAAASLCASSISAWCCTLAVSASSSTWSNWSRRADTRSDLSFRLDFSSIKLCALVSRSALDSFSSCVRDTRRALTSLNFSLCDRLSSFKSDLLDAISSSASLSCLCSDSSSSFSPVITPACARLSATASNLISLVSASNVETELVSFRMRSACCFDFLSSASQSAF